MTIDALPVTLFLGGITNADDPMHTSLGAVVAMLRGEHPEAHLAAFCLRASRNGDSEIFEHAKKSLPVAVFAGHFSYRNSDRCIRYSSLVVIDLDDLDEPEMVRDTLGQDEHVAACFLSPGGAGVKPVFLVDSSDQGDHARAWATCVAYLRDTFGIDAASGAGQHDLCRACFVGLDPQATINPGAIPLPIRSDIPLPTAPKKDATHEAARLVRPNERHAYLIAYCARLASVGLAEPEILAAAQTLVKERFDLSDGRQFADAEISDAVRSALRKFRKEDQVQLSIEGREAAAALLSAPDEAEPIGKMVIWLADDLMRECLRPPPCIIDGLLPVGGIGAIIAQPGVGKSMIAVEIARCIASGQPFGGHATKQGRVLYSCTDAPYNTGRRLLNIGADALPHIVVAPKAPRIPLGLSEYELALDTYPGITLMVLDTWDSCRAHAGGGGYSDNDAVTEGVMSALRELADKRGLSVIIVHHSTKADGTVARGSLVFDARCDWMATVERLSDDCIKLRTTKNRDGTLGDVACWRILADPHPDAMDLPEIPRLEQIEEVEAAHSAGSARLDKAELRLRAVAQAVAEGARTIREIAARADCTKSTAERDMAELLARGWVSGNGAITPAGRGELGLQIG